MKKNKKKLLASQESHPDQNDVQVATEDTPAAESATEAPIPEAVKEGDCPTETPAQDAPAAVEGELKVAESKPKKKKDKKKKSAEETPSNLPEAVTTEEALPAVTESAKDTEDVMSDEEAYQVLGPQSLWAHLAQLVLAPIPYVCLLFTALWISFGGTPLSVGIVASVGAIVLAVFAFWAFGGSPNVNRCRFARAYFLSLAVVAALGALFALLAASYGADLSPVLRRIMNSIHSLS